MIFEFQGEESEDAKKLKGDENGKNGADNGAAANGEEEAEGEEEEEDLDEEELDEEEGEEDKQQFHFQAIL